MRINANINALNSWLLNNYSLDGVEKVMNKLYVPVERSRLRAFNWNILEHVISQTAQAMLARLISSQCRFYSY